MKWELWQIVLTAVGGGLFLIFETLTIIRNIKARKAEKASKAVNDGADDTNTN